MRILPVLAVALLAAAAPAAAFTKAAPKDCGPTPPKYHEIHVDAGTQCDFGLATYHALKAYDKNVHEFYSADERNFVLKVAYSGRKIAMDCRSRTRAHGELDYYCNNLNRGGSRVVQFETLMEP